MKIFPVINNVLTPMEFIKYFRNFIRSLLKISNWASTEQHLQLLIEINQTTFIIIVHILNFVKCIFR